MRILRRLVPAGAVLSVFPVAVGLALTTGGGSQVGPAHHETGNGRVLHPAGVLTRVGNFPTGGALTPNGRFYWAVSTGRGFNDIRIVGTRRHRVVQTVPIPGASGGIAMDPRRPLAYVSGLADSSHTDQDRPKLRGRGGDVVEVYRYSRRTGRARLLRLIPVPPPQDSPIPQNFPPTNTTQESWPDRLAISPDGRRLLVPLNLADHAAIVSLKTRAVSYAAVGHYPYGAAIAPGGKVGLVSNEADGTVSFVDLTTGKVTRTVTVGAGLSHPEAIAIDRARDLAYVTLANTDRIAVLSIRRQAKVAGFSLVRKHGIGAAPVAAALDPRHHRLYVAEEGADDLAVLDVTKTRPRLAGRIPTAAFPTDVAVRTKGCRRSARRCGLLVWLSAKGFGFGPNRHGPNPLSPYDSDNGINHFAYLPSAIRGDVGMLHPPTARRLRRLTPVALRQARPIDGERPPAGTPLRANGPIKHVFFVVKENRTYDQVLGDVKRGDGDPKLELFGPKVTPNAHALVGRFPLLDHVYANSEASIDGHFWTAAASVPDYVQKNWMQNYGGRNRPYDFGVYAVTWPANGFLFDQAQRQHISYFNYGEAIAGVVPLPDRDRSTSQTAEVIRKFAHSDLGAGTAVFGTPAGECYPNDADIETDAITQAQTYDGTPPSGAPANAESRFDCFRQHFEAQLAAGDVPAFNYLVLPNDHTVGTTPGKRTPQALVADNDYGLGQIVDTISHSSIWKSSAIFVVEDDSQDGADHVDAHRIPAYVISPFAKQGAVIHRRYDFLSVIRSMELILGMKPLGFQDAVATPMYDVFTARPKNAAPYTARVPAYNRLTLNTAASPDAALSASLDFRQIDQVPQVLLDRILWHAVHGEGSTPPAPGPDADYENIGRFHGRTGRG